MARPYDINFCDTLSLKLSLPNVCSLKIVRLQFMISLSLMKLSHQVPASPYYFRKHISCIVQITAYLVMYSQQHDLFLQDGRPSYTPVRNKLCYN
jgi:hypothetical protein